MDDKTSPISKSESSSSRDQATKVWHQHKRDALRMAAENNAIKLMLQTITENVQRQKAIIDALKDVLQHLKAEVMLQEEILSGRVQQDYDNSQATHIILALPHLQQEVGEVDEEEDDEEEKEEEDGEEDDDDDGE